MLTRSLLTPSLELSPGMRACSVVSDSATPRTVALQASLSMGFPRQEYWSGLPFPPPGDLPYPGMETDAPALQVDFFLLESSGWLGPSGTGSGITVLPSGGTGAQPSHPAPEPMCLPPRYNHSDKQYARYCSEHSMCASGWVLWKADIKTESVVQ